MGGTASKAEIAVKQLNSIVADVTMRNTTQCVSMVDQTGSTKVVNRGFSFWTRHTVQQRGTINSMCMTQSETINDVTSQLIAELRAEADAQQEKSTLGDILNMRSSSSDSSILHEVESKIRTSLNSENITESINKINQLSNMEYENLGQDFFGGTSVIQEADVATTVIVNVLATSGVHSLIESAAESSSETEESTILGNMSYNVIMGIALVIIAIIVVVFLRRRGSSTPPPYPYPPPYPPPQYAPPQYAPPQYPPQQQYMPPPQQQYILQQQPQQLQSQYTPMPPTQQQPQQ